MRTRNQSKNRFISLENEFKKLNFNRHVRDSGFERRKSRKVNATNLIRSFWNASFGEGISLSKWAQSLSLLTNKSVSKQSIHERINDSFIDLLKRLLGTALGKQLDYQNRGVSGKFSRVLIQDSTCIKLPDSLNTEYKGNYSRGQTKAVAKVQVIYNVTHENFSYFDLSPYTRNDQKASTDIFNVIKSGDLVLRDLGYFAMDALAEIQQRGANFISRLRCDVSLYDIKSQQRINLYQILRKKSFLKRSILIGSKQKICVTLIAIKLNKHIKYQRQIKLKKDRDRRKKITLEKLELQGWDIYITNIKDAKPKEIAEIYRLRWQIEIIFKSWKSKLNLQKNISCHIKKSYIFHAVLYLTLLAVVLIVMPVYKSLRHRNIKISLLKTSSFLLNILVKNNWKMTTWIFNNIRYYTKYEARNRPCFDERIKILT